MPDLSADRPASPDPAGSFPWSSDKAARRAAPWIRSAKAQTHFADAPGLSAREFQLSPGFPKAQEELRHSFLWLKSLLSGTSRDVAVVRDAVGAMARPLSQHADPLTRDEFDLYGQGKHDLLALCEALERDQRPSTVAAACRELRLAFDGTGRLSVGPAGAIAGALTEVWAQSRGPVSPDQRLTDGVRWLAASARQLGLDVELSVEALYGRFLSAAPSGGQHDPVGNMHGFGLGALERLLKRARSPEVDTAEARTALKALLLGLGTGRDPASVILTVLHANLLPTGQAFEVANRIRERVVDAAVRASGTPLLGEESPERREAMLQAQSMAVKDLLGIDYVVAGQDGPEALGLFDTSARSLGRLLDECDRAVAQAHIPYIAA